MLTLCESMLGHLQECGPPTNEDFPEKNFLLPSFQFPKPLPYICQERKILLSLIASSGQVKLDCECGAVKAMMVACSCRSSVGTHQRKCLSFKLMKTVMQRVCFESYSVSPTKYITRIGEPEKYRDLSPELAIFIVSLQVSPSLLQVLESATPGILLGIQSFSVGAFVCSKPHKLPES